MIGHADLDPFVPLLGFDVFVNPLPPFVVLPLTTDGVGHAQADLPLPRSVRRGKFYVQFVFVNTGPCPGSGPFSSTDAIEVTLQPRSSVVARGSR